MVALATRPSRRRIAVMAGVVAVSFLFRHDHGLFVGVASVAVLRWRVARRMVDFRQANGRSDGSDRCLLLPWIAFIALNGGIIEYFQGGLEYARAEADATALSGIAHAALGIAALDRSQC